MGGLVGLGSGTGGMAGGWVSDGGIWESYLPQVYESHARRCTHFHALMSYIHIEGGTL